MLFGTFLRDRSRKPGSKMELFVTMNEPLTIVIIRFPSYFVLTRNI